MADSETCQIVDSGAQISIVSKDVFVKGLFNLKRDKQTEPEFQSIVGVGNKTTKVLYMATMSVGEVMISVHVVDMSTNTVLISVRQLTEAGVDVKFKRKRSELAFTKSGNTLTLGTQGNNLFTVGCASKSLFPSVSELDRRLVHPPTDYRRKQSGYNRW